MRTIRHLKQAGQAGDTIVEVMVVLAILGLAISISYATANRSLLNTRQAQESSQATELVQSQIEALRTLTGASDTPNIFQAGPYCLVPISPAPVTGPFYTLQPGGCSIPSVPYQITVNWVNNPPAQPDTFTITARWADVTGQGNDTLTTIYRLHQTP